MSRVSPAASDRRITETSAGRWDRAQDRADDAAIAVAWSGDQAGGIDQRIEVPGVTRRFVEIERRWQQEIARGRTARG